MSLFRRISLFGRVSGNEAEVNANGELLVNSNQMPFGYNASGGMRVSQMTTLLDGKILGEDDSDLFENVGTGTATYTSNKLNLSVTSGQYIIRQSKRFTPYFSGKPQLIECTFDNFQTEANTTKRVGYFSSNAVAPYDSTKDGIYIENNNGTFKLKAERLGTSVIDIDFTAMDNYDSISAYDWSNFSVIAFDFLWLGGAILRFFVKTANGFELIHSVNYSGTATNTFISSPNQPLRYEIRSTTGTGSLRYICSQIATEGSINEAGKTLGLFNSSTISCNTVGTIFAIKSIKKQATFRDTAIQIIDIQLMLGATSDAGILLLIKNPTLSSAITYVNKGKIQEGTPTNQTITAGTGRVICGANVGQNGGGTDAMKENFLAFLSHTIANSMDEYVLAYLPLTNNQNVAGIINIKEF